MKFNKDIIRLNNALKYHLSNCDFVDGDVDLEVGIIALCYNHHLIMRFGKLDQFYIIRGKFHNHITRQLYGYNHTIESKILMNISTPRDVLLHVN